MFAVAGCSQPLDVRSRWMFAVAGCSQQQPPWKSWSIASIPPGTAFSSFGGFPKRSFWPRPFRFVRLWVSPNEAFGRGLFFVVWGFPQTKLLATFLFCFFRLGASPNEAFGSGLFVFFVWGFPQTQLLAAFLFFCFFRLGASPNEAFGRGLFVFFVCGFPQTKLLAAAFFFVWGFPQTKLLAAAFLKTNSVNVKKQIPWLLPLRLGYKLCKTTLRDCYHCLPDFICFPRLIPLRPGFKLC